MRDAVEDNLLRLGLSSTTNQHFWHVKPGPHFDFRSLYFVHLVVPIGISPMGNSDRFPQGKPAAIESRYPTLINCMLGLFVLSKIHRTLTSSVQLFFFYLPLRLPPSMVPCRLVHDGRLWRVTHCQTSMPSSSSSLTCH